MVIGHRHSLAAAYGTAGGSSHAQLAAPATTAPSNRVSEFDVVDAQVHANKFRGLSDPAAILEAVVGAMDALGITAAVVDEYTGLDQEGHMLPGARDAQGSWIPQRPFSRLAVEKYPDRFRYLWRIDIQDPQLPRLMKMLREAEPGAVALRVHTGPRRVAWSDPLFANGGYAPYFELAERNHVPVFIAMAPQADLLAPYAKQFPALNFIVDHMGLVSGNERPPESEPAEQRLRRFDRVIELAKYPNVAIKWCHIERIATRPYPFEDVMPGLRRLVDAFGAQRVMWASDATETARPDRSPFPSTWAQALHHVMDTGLLTPEEKSWILGRTARSILKWT